MIRTVSPAVAPTTRPPWRRAAQAALLGALFLSPCAGAQDSLVRWYVEAGMTKPEIGNIAIGFHLNPTVSLEAGYRASEEPAHFGGTQSPLRADGFDGFEAALRTTTFLSQRLAVTSRVGLYHYEGESTVFVPATNSFRADKESGYSPVIGIGLRYELAPTWGLTVEYLHSDAFSASRRSSSGRLALGLRLSF